MSFNWIFQFNFYWLNYRFFECIIIVIIILILNLNSSLRLLHLLITFSLLFGLSYRWFLIYIPLWWVFYKQAHLTIGIRIFLIKIAILKLSITWNTLFRTWLLNFHVFICKIWIGFNNGSLFYKQVLWIFWFVRVLIQFSSNLIQLICDRSLFNELADDVLFIKSRLRLTWWLSIFLISIHFKLLDDELVL